MKLKLPSPMPTFSSLSVHNACFNDLYLTIYCIIALHITVMAVCRAWVSLLPLFSTNPLLGAYLLTTYTYKHMPLLTRVCSMGECITIKEERMSWKCRVIV